VSLTTDLGVVKKSKTKIICPKTHRIIFIG
jgi:hypothetical protein